MNPLKITLLSDRVAVEPIATEEKTASGIMIPDTAKEKPLKGHVVAIGPGFPAMSPMTVKVGDKVLYGMYSGQEVELDGKGYLIMRESDIIAIL